MARVVGADTRIAPAGLDAIAGARGVAVERRGKWIRVALEADGGSELLFLHLGMTGRWCRLEDGAAKLPQERLRFELEKGGKRSAVAYLDTRRFGRVLSAREDVEAWTELGPDPIADGIDLARLHDEFQARRTTAKVALLDQTLLAGIGNIHATEALWLARIDPRTPTRAFTKADIRTLARGIDTTLRRGLAQQEGEVPAYVNQGAENRFHIYDRKGPCPRCKHALRKITLGGRTTTFCPGCQKRLTAPRTKPTKSRR